MRVLLPSRLFLAIHNCRASFATSSASLSSPTQVRDGSFPLVKPHDHHLPTVSAFLTADEAAQMAAGHPQLEPLTTSYHDLHQFSIQQPDKFWGTLARSRLQWMRPCHTISDCDMNQGKVAWFLGGKLNVTENCVDRHLRTNPEKVALIWERDEPGQEERVTYRQLHDMMNRVANVLLGAGVTKGSRVGIYMGSSPLAVASMLACARLGAIHTVVFAGFSAESLAARMKDAGATVLITTAQACRGGRCLSLREIVENALPKCPSVRTLLVSSPEVTKLPAKTSAAKVMHLEKEMEGLGPGGGKCDPVPMDSEDPLFLLYTSGSTGSPKGLVHTQAGYLLYAAVTHKHVFDLHEGDIFGCVADIGWITGHSYVVYGPLANGCTTLLFESTPTYPNPGRYWEVVQRLRLTHLYASPTAIRLLLRYGDDWVRKYDRSSLRVLASVGEPINNEAWHWFHDLVGDGQCDLVDTYWQTETGGVCIAPRPSDPNAEIQPAMAMRPFFGIQPTLMDQQGKEIPETSGKSVSGSLCFKHPWPGMARSVWGSPQRYFDTYFSTYPGYFFTGDGAHRTAEGYYQITGRMDDVINVTGHRLGTAEVEDAMDDHPLVSETAVVGFPHDVKGEAVYAYVVLKENVSQPITDIIKDLKVQVRSKIAAYAVPEVIQVCPGLPRTRSGKIMRRILRKVAANNYDDLGDTSTLADPSVVPIIVDTHHRLTNNRSNK